MNPIFTLTSQEFDKQKNTLNLIASENYPSSKVLNLLGSIWSNKYAEGYPGKRYYAGNFFTDQLELMVQQKALQVFDTTGEYGVNVQVLSGSPANAMVFLSILNPGDTIMSLNIDNGGHISHLHKTSSWLRFFKLINYDVSQTGIDPDSFEIDIDDFRAKIIANKPKLVIIGFSAYPRQYKFAQMCQIAHDQGCFVLADIAHINGLVAAGLHDTPFQSGDSGADFVSMTTHKTLRGPRGAMLFAKNYWPAYLDKYTNEFQPDKTKPIKSLIEIIDRTVFPGTSGGPHLHQMAAVGQCLLEILGEDQYPDNLSFKDYSQKVIENCQILEQTLQSNGLPIISPTQTHLCLIKLPETLDSLKVQLNLESLGIITNRNKIPFDTKSAWRPSGLRLGTAALTSRGMTGDQFQNLGGLISDSILNRKSVDQITKESLELANSLNWWY